MLSIVTNKLMAGRIHNNPTVVMENMFESNKL